MKVVQENGNKNGFFLMMDGETVVGRLSYVWAGMDKIIIDHTGVDPELRGKGVGRSLIEKAVEFAREGNIKIKPLCPFASTIFDRLPELNDVRM